MRKVPKIVGPRPDQLTTDNPELSEALFNASGQEPPLATAKKVAPAKKALNTTDSIREDVIEPPASDPNAFERIMGESDLTSINYLERGRRAAAAVCRIRVPSKGGEWYGTGFLVGPRLLLTNNHVLGSEAEAAQAEVEFEYEHDLDGVLKPPVAFNLCPNEIFFSDTERDFTLVAITPCSEGGVPIQRYGWLPLLPLSGKSADKEWVTIIQHPGGDPKQISIRSSRILLLSKKQIKATNTEHFIHYLTDTEPGSSGSPVLNDQWNVVALHHKAVAAPPDPKNPDAPIVWIGNEGVRISAIFSLLERERLQNTHARMALERLESGIGYSRPVGFEGYSDDFEGDGKAYDAKRWAKSSLVGYKPDFLSQAIDLSSIYKDAKQKDLVAPLLSGKGFELDYHRFSVVVHRLRKFAILTAVNIDGKKIIHPGERNGSWRVDERMDAVYQPAGNFYEKAKGKDKVQFSRGHMVRRLDPCWGENLTESKLGEDDTFHYANAAPQQQTYNDSDWGNLEDYVLDKAQISEKRLTVFQGPIFRDDDPIYGREREGGPWQIPQSYWKIAVLQKTKDRIAAAAFIIGQTQYIKALYEAKVFTKLNPYSLEEMQKRKIQTSIAAIEKETGLDFSALRPFDAHGSLESTRQTRILERLEDIII